MVGSARPLQGPDVWDQRLSERLGHASAKITWDIYQRVTPTMQADAAETVARLIFGTDA